MEYRTAKDLVGALQRREMSAVELLERTIADIEQRDADINAVVVRDFERARAAAAQADNALACGDRRPLLGVPITVKEAYNVAGLPTTWGIVGTELGRASADLMLAMDVVVGPDDAQATGYRLELPPPRHTALAGFRVLVLDRHPLLPTSNAVRDAIERFADDLARAGCRVGRTSPLMPDLAQVTSMWRALLAAFSGADLPADEYRRMQAEAAASQTRPDDPNTASLRATVMSHRDWVHADRARVGVAHQWRLFFRDWDVVVCPVLPTVAFPQDHGPMDERRIDVDGQQVPYVQQGVWSALATLTGLPATAIPVARSADGLPIGVQVIGPYLEDRTPLRFAELVERELGGFVAPPGS